MVVGFGDLKVDKSYIVQSTFDTDSPRLPGTMHLISAEPMPLLTPLRKYVAPCSRVYAWFT
jgi:hypothetical protein